MLISVTLRPKPNLSNVVNMTCGRHTRNYQVLKCYIHDLWQVYTKLSGTEMSYTWPVAGIHETVRYWNVIYMTYIAGIHETVRYWNVIYMTYIAGIHETVSSLTCRCFILQVHNKINKVYLYTCSLVYMFRWMFANWKLWSQSGQTKDKRIQLATRNFCKLVPVCLLLFCLL